MRLPRLVTRPVEREVRVKSIRRILDSDKDWLQLAALLAEQAEFVVSNTTEAGLSVPPTW